jgi:hypothetical protein
MGRREELLRAEAEGWEELGIVLAGLDPDGLERPGVNAEGWSVKDLMWHVAYWCGEAVRVCGEIAQGTFDPASEQGRDIDAINDEQFARSRSLPLEEVRSELHRARGAMIRGFGSLEEITPDADEWFEESGPIHYADHLRELRDWASRDRI